MNLEHHGLIELCQFVEPPTIEFALLEWSGGSAEITMHQILFKLG